MCYNYLSTTLVVTLYSPVCFHLSTIHIQGRVKVQSQRTLTLQAQVKGVVFLRVPFYTTDSVLCTAHITALHTDLFYNNILAHPLQFKNFIINNGLIFLKEKDTCILDY